MTNLLTFPLYALLLFALPGYLLACVLWPARSGLTRLVIAVSGAGMLVGGLTIAWVQTIGTPCTLPVLFGLSSAASVGLALCRPRDLRLRLDAADRRAVALALAVGTLYLVHYDRELFQFNCVNEASRLVLGESRPDVRVDTDYLLTGNANVRLGSVALVAPAFIAFDFFGPRLLYATTFALCFAIGVLIARRLKLSEPWAIATGALLALNPWLGAIAIVDENLFGYTATSLLVLAALEDETPLVWIGLVLGFLLGIRHIALLMGGGIGLMLFRRKPPLRQLAGFGAVLALVCLLWATHHVRVFGTPFSFESFREYRAAHPHGLLGLEFTFSGLLNYPFHESFVRTPYNPYPTLLMVPLFGLNRFGVLGIALMLIGLVWLHRRSALDLPLVLLLSVPYVLLMAFLESWMQPNKMGIPLVVLPPLVVAIVCGTRVVLRPPRWRLGVLVGLALALFGAQAALATWEVTPDERVYALEDAAIRRERAEYVAWERAHLVRHNPLPDLTRFAEYSPFEPARKLLDVWFDLTHAATIHPPKRPIVDRGAAPEMIRIELDLSRPLLGRAGWARQIDSNPDDPVVRLDPARDEGYVAIQAGGKRLPWSDQPSVFVALPLAHEDTVHLVLEFSEDGLLDDVRDGGSPRDEVAFRRPRIVVELPRGATLRVTEVIADTFSRYYRWDLPTAPFEAPDEPRIVFTN